MHLQTSLVGILDISKRKKILREISVSLLVIDNLFYFILHTVSTAANAECVKMQRELGYYCLRVVLVVEGT